jgi:hypothetical protein
VLDVAAGALHIPRSGFHRRLERRRFAVEIEVERVVDDRDQRVVAAGAEQRVLVAVPRRVGTPRLAV